MTSSFAFSHHRGESSEAISETLFLEDLDVALSEEELSDELSDEVALQGVHKIVRGYMRW